MKLAVRKGDKKQDHIGVPNRTVASITQHSNKKKKTATEKISGRGKEGEKTRRAAPSGKRRGKEIRIARNVPRKVSNRQRQSRDPHDLRLYSRRKETLFAPTVRGRKYPR